MEDNKDAQFLRACRYRVRPGATVPRVDVVKDGALLGVASLIDISSSGVAIETRAQVLVGSDCVVSVERIGTYPVRIERKFDSFKYGAKFLIDVAATRRLERILQTLCAA